MASAGVDVWQPRMAKGGQDKISLKAEVYGFNDLKPEKVSITFIRTDICFARIISDTVTDTSEAS